MNDSKLCCFLKDFLPSMPMSSRLDVSCPQPRFPCCLLIQFQLKPKKSMTIFLPTVSLSVCCRYNLCFQRKNPISAHTQSLGMASPHLEIQIHTSTTHRDQLQPCKCQPRQILTELNSCLSYELCSTPNLLF